MEYRKLGQFRLQESVASGGMGEIFKSVDDAGRVVALKKILTEHQQNSKFRDLFIREAEITFVLDHPNIVRAYGFDRVGEQLVLALEYLEGVNLKEVLRKIYDQKLVIPLVVVAEIMKCILVGLDYAHKKKDKLGRSLGIIHRDLNPSNIFLTYAGEVKILDFGISKATEKDVHQLTPKGELRGKMCYLSPEQLIGTKIDRRADVFACGIVMWELITGHPLFLKDTDTEVLEAIRSGEYRSPSEFRVDLPAGFDVVLRKALAVNPRNRYQSCAEFAAAVARVAGTQLMPGVGPEDVSTFVRSLFQKDTKTDDPMFMSSYAWLLTQTRGQEERGLQIAVKVAQDYGTSPFVNLNLAKTLLACGRKSEGLRLLRKLSRVDSIEEVAQDLLVWLGVRRSPVVHFLRRSNPLNRVLGLARHKILGPTPFQSEFLAA